jgi:alpha-galactosidase
MVKIAITGAGSLEFTSKLVYDVLTVPELQDTHFAFHDVSAENLDAIARLCRRDIRANGFPATVTATTDRREAFADADYVICTLRAGGVEAWTLDIDIPLRYGVDQCVGDTISAGGLMYAQRTIPILLEICRDMRELARPGALLLMYSNPMAMNTWACNRYGGVPTVGLCHGVQGSQRMIARAVTLWARENGMIGTEGSVTPAEMAVIAAGINHQTWFVKIEWRGIDFVPKLLSLLEAIPEIRKREKVRLDVLRRFGYWSTESNGHLSEYLPWYRKRPDEIPRWIDMDSWIDGQTGGALRVRIEGRAMFEHDAAEMSDDEAPRITPEGRSDEHGSYIIESLETGRVYRGHFNVPNRGNITNLPDGCIVEIPGYVDGTGINMPVAGALPLGCAATCAASVREQEMGMEAAVHGDVTLLKQAMLHDPLVGAVCDPEEVWQMVDEMLVAEAQWLPQYTAAIPAATERLAEAEQNGTRVPARSTWTATRKEPMTVAEMLEARG